MKITKATKEDLVQILDLQKLAFTREARLHNNYNIQPMTQSLEEVEAEYKTKIFLKIEDGSKIIGSVRANLNGEECWVNKLMVHPEYQCRGIGKSLLLEIEKYFPEVKKFKLATSTKSYGNIRLYESTGYVTVKIEKMHDGVEGVFMEKVNNCRKSPEGDFLEFNKINI